MFSLPTTWKGRSPRTAILLNTARSLHADPSGWGWFCGCLYTSSNRFCEYKIIICGYIIVSSCNCKHVIAAIKFAHFKLNFYYYNSSPSRWFVFLIKMNIIFFEISYFTIKNSFSIKLILLKILINVGGKWIIIESMMINE